MCKRVEMQSVKQLIASQKVFQIAYYQRGYRWREQQITQLLDDLCGFVKTHKNPFYFMQALVVVNEEENKWRVIDGQQRLTSIKLILQKIFPDSSDNNSNIKMEYERNLQQQEVGALDAHFRDKTTEIIDNYLKNLSNEAKEKLGKSIKECEFLLYTRLG